MHPDDEDTTMDTHVDADRTPAHGAVDVLGHKQLLREGERAAAALRRLGVREGDPVAVALPMSLESVVVTLACIRLGAQRVTLPVQGQLSFVRDRVNGSGARLVVTADSCRTADGPRDVKAGIDRALWDCPAVHTVLVVPQVARPVPWVPGRDLWWHEALTNATVPAGSLTPDPYAGGMTSTPRQHRPLADPLAALDFDDPLDQRSADDSDHGWGERLEDGRGGTAGGPGAAGLAHLLRERPPHHL